jgi:hypothetical protein
VQFPEPLVPRRRSLEVPEPIKAPVTDMIEIGAGGGSIAEIDEVGVPPGELMEASVPAATGLPHATNVRSRNDAGQVYADRFFMAVGRAHARDTTASGRCINCWSRMSGGPGRRRGGGAWARASAFATYTITGCRRFSVYPEGVEIRIEGRFGAQAGGPVQGLVCDLADNVVHDCGTGELVTLDRVVEVQLAGGSGFGGPGNGHRGSRLRRRPRLRICRGHRAGVWRADLGNVEGVQIRSKDQYIGLRPARRALASYRVVGQKGGRSVTGAGPANACWDASTSVTQAW